MKIQQYRTLFNAFVIKEADLNKLNQLFASLGGSVEYTAKMADNRTITCENLDEFIRNAVKYTRFIELKVSTFTPKGYIRLKMDMARDAVVPMFYVVETDEENMWLTDVHLREWVDSVKPWYSWFARVRIYWVLFVLGEPFLGLSVLNSLASGNYALSSRHLFSLGYYPATTLLNDLVVYLSDPTRLLRLIALTAVDIVLFIIGISLLQGFLGSLRSRIFPTGTLAIGNELGKYIRLERFRRGMAFVVTTLTLAVLGNLIYSLLVKR